MIKIKGFSLIELVIVILIISILVIVAVPSFQKYTKATKRAEMRTEMIRIAQRLQSYRVINHNYADASLTLLGSEEDQGTYILELTDIDKNSLDDTTANTQTWLLVATPSKRQVGDGHLVLNHLGYKCWQDSSDKNGGTACTPTATSNWDGR